MTRADNLSKVRYYRWVAQMALEHWVEFEEGSIHTLEGNALFDERYLNYRIDIGNALKRLSDSDQTVLMAIHRDGLTHIDALKQVGIEPGASPGNKVATIEVRFGRLLERLKLDTFPEYLSRPE